MYTWSIIKPDLVQAYETNVWPRDYEQNENEHLNTNTAAQEVA